MEDRVSLETKYSIATQVIKTAILQSQYRALKLVNQEQLALYYGIGRYISGNSRKGYWGTGAIAFISSKLQTELPGLRGFSERNLKLMRTFYEEWKMLDTHSLVATDKSKVIDDIDVIKSSVITDDLEEIRQLQLPDFGDFPVEEFFKISFTHHIAILSQVKTIEERYFYIKLCAHECLKVDALKKVMRADFYHNQGTFSNNFMAKLPNAEFARRAILSFKDEYILDFINVEELGARDIEDVEEELEFSDCRWSRAVPPEQLRLTLVVNALKKLLAAGEFRGTATELAAQLERQGNYWSPAMLSKYLQGHDEALARYGILLETKRTNSKRLLCLRYGDACDTSDGSDGCDRHSYTRGIPSLPSQPSLAS